MYDPFQTLSLPVPTPLAFLTVTLYDDLGGGKVYHLSVPLQSDAGDVKLRLSEVTGRDRER